MAILDENYTLTYAGHFQSDGGAITLTTPFDPDCLMMWNYTAYGTARDNVQIVWFKDFPAADALVATVVADNGSTGDTSSNLVTTNGITSANTDGGVSALRNTITGVSQADPGVVTVSAAHGLAVGDHVRIASVVGMVELNNNEYRVGAVPSTTTFELQTVQGDNVDTSGFTAYSSGGVAQQIRGTGTDAYDYLAPTYNLTLGTSVVNNDNDEIYFIAWKFGSYVDLGDQA